MNKKTSVNFIKVYNKHAEKLPQDLCRLDCCTHTIFLKKHQKNGLCLKYIYIMSRVINPLKG